MERELIEFLQNDDVINLCKLYMKKKWYENINMGYVYRRVKDIPNNSVESFIGFLYLQGLYLNKDEQLGINYIKSSADNGNANAQANYGCLMSKQRRYKTALKYLTMSIEQDNPLGYNNILVLKYNIGFSTRPIKGENVVDDDFPALEELIEYGLKSHYAGHLSARNNLIKIIKSYMSLSKMVMIMSEKKHLLDIKCNKLEKENKELRINVKELEEENIHLRYKPDGIGYEETLKHFNELT